MNDSVVLVQNMGQSFFAWWRHQTETFSALMAICVGNSPVNGEFPTQRPVTWSFDIFFHLRLNKQLSNNRGAGDLRRYRAHYDVIIIDFENSHGTVTSHGSHNVSNHQQLPLCSTTLSVKPQRNHQNSFVGGVNRSPMDSRHKVLAMR